MHCFTVKLPNAAKEVGYPSSLDIDCQPHVPCTVFILQVLQPLIAEEGHVPFTEGHTAHKLAPHSRTIPLSINRWPFHLTQELGECQTAFFVIPKAKIA